MAIKRVVIDDLDGKSEGAEPVFFSLNDLFYRLDLAPANLKKLTDALSPFIEKSESAEAPKGGKRVPATNGHVEADPATIRAWLSANGHVVTAKGRIPEDLAALYYKAQEA